MTTTILLVDDNRVQVATRKAILTTAGKKVVIAESAERALALLNGPELANSIKLVITDHLMPGMNGPQFIACLRQSFPVLPVLVVSGMDAEAEYQGMNVLYRLKPLAPEELILLTRSLCEDKLGRTA